MVGSVFVQTKVSTRFVVIFDVFCNKPKKMTLIQNNEKVETLTLDTHGVKSPKNVQYRDFATEISVLFSGY